MDLSNFIDTIGHFLTLSNETSPLKQHVAFLRRTEAWFEELYRSKPYRYTMLNDPHILAYLKNEDNIAHLKLDDGAKEHFIHWLKKETTINDPQNL